MAILLAALCACAPRTPTPPLGSHVSTRPQRVPYPPPAARSELIPPMPADEALWVDGQWLWIGDGWTWQAGDWARPSAGAYYAPPKIERRADGELVWFEGHWVRDPAE
jgi:hypothetical protein